MAWDLATVDCRKAVCGGWISGRCGRALVVPWATKVSAAKNNQLRTGADKGNPTV
jgi:hypothetical protein